MNKKASILREIILTLFFTVVIIFLGWYILSNLFNGEDKPDEYYVIEDQLNYLQNHEFTDTFSLYLPNNYNLNSYFKGENKPAKIECQPDQDCLCLVINNNDGEIRKSHCFRNTLVIDERSQNSQNSNTNNAINLNVNLPSRYKNMCPEPEVETYQTGDQDSESGQYVTNLQEVNNCLRSYGLEYQFSSSRSYGYSILISMEKQDDNSILLCSGTC